MFWCKLSSVSEPPSPKKTHFLPKNGQKKPFFWLQTVFWGPEWAVVGPPTLFSGCWTQRNVFCKVLEQVIDCFGAAITKKPHFFAPKCPKNSIFPPKQGFWGLTGQFQGPPPYFEGARVTTTCFATFWSTLLSVSEPPSPKKPLFLPKNGKKMPFCSLKQRFGGLSGQL